MGLAGYEYKCSAEKPDYMSQLLDLLLFLLPIYVANSSPVVLGGGMPLDLNLCFFDGRRVFGEGKTIRGFIGGVLCGTLAGGIAAIFYQSPFFPSQGVQFAAAFALSFGALAGDAFGSFIKRRMGVDSGKPFFLDTILFLIIALIIVYPLALSSLYEPLDLAFFLILTAVLHPLTNILANRVGLKKVPW
jgi:CDP-2,3-bis-(O-geranylgeranyl)-sn-glycerol synthase